MMPDLPKYLELAIMEFKIKYPFIKENPRNRCIDASFAFLHIIKDLESTKDYKNKGYVFPELKMLTEYMRNTMVNDEEHHYVCIDGYNIDFTMIQYDKNADWPKIWKD